MSLNKLASQLFLSRPTLNSYIKQFEEKEKLSNENYNKIFQKLFNGNQKDEETFKDQVNIFSLMLQKEKNLTHSQYSNENKNIMNSIIKKMQEDLQGKEETNPLYKFINSAIHNYEKDHVLQAYINYNLYLNGLKDLHKIKAKEKKLISNLFPLMKSYVESSLNFNEQGYNNFLFRVNEIKEKRLVEKKEIEKKIKEEIEKEIEKKIHQGINIKELDIKELLKNIKI